MAYFLSTIQSSAYSQTGTFRNSYVTSLIHYNGDLVNDTQTIFRNQITNQAFIGTVSNIVVDKNGVSYDSIIKEEIDFSIISTLGIKNWAGWYYISDEDYGRIININNEKHPKAIKTKAILHFAEPILNTSLPMFYKDLISTTNPDIFEDLTYVFFKLMGINDSIQIDRKDAAGRGDGFFKISTLCVIYDCTLRHPFLPFKDAQLNNYCNDLMTGHFTYKNQTFTTTGLNKQVWVITKGKSQKISTKNNVHIKEISIDSLKEIYLKRIQANYNEIALANELSNL